MAGFNGTGARSGFPPATGLADALTGRPVRRHTATGAFYVRKAGWEHFWARALDAAVFVAAYGVVALLLAAVRSAMFSSGVQLALNDTFFLVLHAVLWFVGLFIYGMIWGTAGSVGDAAGGMRSVRTKDGTTAGAWLGGWRAVCWSFFPFYVVVLVFSAFSGGGDSWDPQFVAIDLRSGVAQGQQPQPTVPATVT
ncbi:RDD family protein [Arthrobacter sp. CJ23]|uniref:RDD family protein n=1 Tax=Arthrobacter sp. CJ23 TaxID=2972479 RepID=UPI00215BC1BD|nr:RDD family protein [Arthrobacter sp. CJ23]UVJ39716.1 RDD family protein [Arthrobacter sp. CJ23]